MNSIRVLITDKCNAGCSNCINKAIRSGVTFMEYSRFTTIARYFHDNNVPRIRLMGGEPTIHPDFESIAKFSQNLFSRVTVFTNGLNENLLRFCPRENDGINYNARFAQKMPKEYLMPDKPGSRTLSVVIDSRLNVQSMISTISNIHEIIRKLKVSLTFDCTANIFQQRNILLNKFNLLYDFCISQGIEVIIDHGLPICFLYGSNVPTCKGFSKCSEDCAGMIDANANLRFCNQNSLKAFPIFEGDKIKPFKLLNNWLQLAFYQRQATVLKKICVECPFYGEICNGGCYIHHPIISREDILLNTELPTVHLNK